MVGTSAFGLWQEELSEDYWLTAFCISVDFNHQHREDKSPRCWYLGYIFSQRSASLLQDRFKRSSKDHETMVSEPCRFVKKGKLDKVKSLAWYTTSVCVPNCPWPIKWIRYWSEHHGRLITTIWIECNTDIFPSPWHGPCLP